eukprot:CAMPEP_0205819046 /NCGR_PEP_ID=MMETSP0206-20130828/1207_1 /ASSEMBLY_ACC=CAM_ASM_000279 /TAXON_ID=36767 /ORGANISM="Euplotes focardii, Strain TN1" /LENGTH=550 /DNA_ID=CAMNT_0053112095 /DNA_START=13 /DNA_END=1662 /DNA_ORIENTATION=-
MEKSTLFIDKESLITVLFPYFDYADSCVSTLRLLSKKTKNLYDDNTAAYHRIFEKRVLKLHYPKFERLIPALQTNSRWAQYKLDFQLKFPDDYGIFEQFLVDHPTVQFEHLHLVISDDSLEAANKLIDTMREIEMLGPNCNETYKWLDSSNYCRAANMKTKLRFETELIIGAEPSAFIDKVEEIGLLDVRNVSRCPVEEIDIPVYSITVDGEFCTSLEGGEREIKESFTSSVRKAIFEDEAKKVAETLDQHVENLKKGYPLCDNIELYLNGEELKAEEVHGMFSHPQVTRIEYEGLEEEEAVRIESNDIIFAVADGSTSTLLKARNFSFEFFQDNYNTQGEFVVINPKSSNILIEGITRDTDTVLYNDINALNYDAKHIVIHQSQIHHVEFKSVPTNEPEVFPNRKLTLYINEQESYDNLSSYLIKVPNAVPVNIDLDMAFIDNMEASKSIMDDVFAKNLAVLNIVMEMHETEFIDHLYALASGSKTLRECTLILHQDCKKVVEFINNSTQIEQFNLDMRVPIEEDQGIIKTMLGKEKNNRLVLRDVHEW